MHLIRVIYNAFDKESILLVKDKDKAIRELDEIKKWHGINKLKEAEKIALGVVKAIDSVEILDMATDYLL